MGETSMPVGTCTAYRAQLTAGSRVRSTSELLAELEHGRVTFHAPASPRRQLEAVCRARCRCSGTPGWCAVVPMTSCPRVSSRFTGVCVCGDCGSGFEPRSRGERISRCRICKGSATDRVPQRLDTSTLPFVRAGSSRWGLTIDVSDAIDTVHAPEHVNAVTGQTAAMSGTVRTRQEIRLALVDGDARGESNCLDSWGR